MVKQIGPHRLRCGSALDNLDDLMQGTQVDLLYSDPPWGSGNLKYWATMARKDTGHDEQPVTYEDFLRHIYALARRHGAQTVVIEYGLRWQNEVIQLAEEAGYTHRTTAHPVYRGGRSMLPMHLHLFSREPLPIDLSAYREAILGTSGLKTVRAAMQPLIEPGSVVMDPCCGKGLGASVAADANAAFHGNEMNAKRLAETEAKLRKRVS